uniref:Uncharacterized protein n=1 Tax=Anopheles farauti TaxID=69004 RepID=A0A182PZS1_9DIPT
MWIIRTIISAVPVFTNFIGHPSVTPSASPKEQNSYPQHLPLCIELIWLKPTQRVSNDGYRRGEGYRLIQVTGWQDVGAATAETMRSLKSSTLKRYRSNGGDTVDAVEQQVWRWSAGLALESADDDAAEAPALSLAMNCCRAVRGEALFDCSRSGDDAAMASDAAAGAARYRWSSITVAGGGNDVACAPQPEPPKITKTSAPRSPEVHIDIPSSYDVGELDRTVVAMEAVPAPVAAPSVEAAPAPRAAQV